MSLAHLATVAEFHVSRRVDVEVCDKAEAEAYAVA